jgi:uncharacterized protein (DUF885 family)
VIDRRHFLSRAASTALAAMLPLGAVEAAAGRGHPTQPQRSPSAQAADTVLTSVSDDLLAEYPDDATFLGLDTGRHAALHSRLPDRSLAGDARRAAGCAARLKRLRAIDTSALTPLDKVNVETTIHAHELAEEGYRRFRYGDNVVLHAWQAESNSPYVVSQGAGHFATIPDFLDSSHKVETKADADAYLERLRQFAIGLDGETERLRHDAALGSIAPDFLLDTALKQQTEYRARPVKDWGLVSSLANRAARANIAGDWRASAERICSAEVGPALDRQIAELKALRSRATSDAGCWKLPDGDAYYRWLLRVGTTTSMSPQEVHDLGLEQVRLLSDEMDKLLRQQGMTKGTVGERLSALNKDPRFLFANDDKGRAELLAYLNQVIATMRARLPQAFATLHKAALVIKRVPPEIEAGAPDGYEQDGPIDGSRPASYYINLRDTANWPKFTLPTLCCHEGIPGHVWQGTFVHKLPTIRSQLMFNAYVEGWALYAEQLGDELGLYADDPFGRLGYLQSIQFRACRLVVDTGLHAKRWTREQAIRWLVENNGDPEDSARGEIDRYCAWPGQACGYQIGHLHIDGLRSKTKQALGDRFDLRLFNDALLTSGSLPLNVLDEVIDRHIAARST